MFLEEHIAEYIDLAKVFRGIFANFFHLRLFEL